MNNKFALISIFIIISIVLNYNWLIYSVFNAGDQWYFFSETILSFPFFNTWISLYSGTNISLWRIPSEILYFISGDPSFGLKLWQYIPYILSTPIASYIFVKEYFTDRKAIVGGMLFFISNTYYLAINSQAHIPLSIASNLMIISYVLFKRAWQNNKSISWVLFVLVLFATGSYDFRFVYIGYILFFIHVVFNIKSIDLKRLIYGFLYNAIFIFLNIFWLLPFSQTGGGSGVGRELFGKHFWTLINAITLYHPFWRVDGPIKWFEINNIPIYYWVFPIIITVSIIFSFRKNKEVTLFSIFLVVGLLLSKMNNSPFGEIYSWLYNNLPGFNAFRESTKFYSIILLAYTFFIANLINLSKSVYKNIILLFISFVFVINIIPIFRGTAGEMYKPVTVNEDYKKFASFIENQNISFNVLWVPTTSKFSYESNTNKVLRLPNINQILQDNLGQELDSILDNKIEFINDQTLNNILDMYGVKYVVIPNQDVINNDDAFYYYGGINDPNIRDWYIQELEKIDWLEKKDLGFNELVVYENKDYKDRIYLTKEPETIYKDIEDQKVEFNQITPAEYRVKINNLDETAYLNFVEAYDPNWKMRIGDFDWKEVLYKQNYFIDDSKHTKSEIEFNNFELSKDYIKSNFDKSYYKENPDGSIDIELTLYFKPQSYFYLGTIISGTTLILCLSYLGYTFYRNINSKHIFINKNPKHIQKS